MDALSHGVLFRHRNVVTEFCKNWRGRWADGRAFLLGQFISGNIKGGEIV